MKARRVRQARTSGVRARAQVLHDRAQGRSPVVLLIIDAINDFTFPDSEKVLPAAQLMARRIHRLRRLARRAGVPTIYVNDNFGRWRSDFRSLVAHCRGVRSPGRAIANLLQPRRADYFVLKPSHSGFYSTTLELLLEHLGARTLVLTGLLADSCVLFTAQEAHMRGYGLVVPEDCVAARTPEDTRRALAQVRRVLRADTRSSEALSLDKLQSRAGRAAR